MNCLRSVLTIAKLVAKIASKPFSLTNSWQKPPIFRCFDVFSVRSLEIFQVQAKLSTIRPVFPDYLSISYDYGAVMIIFWGFQDFLIYMAKSFWWLLNSPNLIFQLFFCKINVNKVLKYSCFIMQKIITAIATTHFKLKFIWLYVLAMSRTRFRGIYTL